MAHASIFAHASTCVLVHCISYRLIDYSGSRLQRVYSLTRVNKIVKVI